MSEVIPPENSLVLYKTRPARVQRSGDKLTIELLDGDTLRVRPKDVVLLHRGPLTRLSELHAPEGVEGPRQGEAQIAWEILAGQQTTLSELAELAFGRFTPETAWAAWELVADGLYFRGTPEQIFGATPDEVAATIAARTAETAEKQAWKAFLVRARAGACIPEDARYLREVESLALGESSRSRVMRTLGREESPENAHAFLLELGIWDHKLNPYPRRLAMPLTAPPPPVEWPDSARDLPPEERLDLTSLTALAIDDAYTQTPDDALSFVAAPGAGAGGGRLWVHVADPAALVLSGDSVDVEARARGASLHLPEGVVPMLSECATPLFGLGLAEISPALSFGMDLDSSGNMAALEVIPSWVRVTRLTYEVAEKQLNEEPLHSLLGIAHTYVAKRRANGAIEIELPEVAVRVSDGTVQIEPVVPLQSRVLVENAMIMTGEAVARLGLEHGIPLPYATQDPPESLEPAAGLPPKPPAATKGVSGGRPAQADSGCETWLAGLAGMYALRRSMKRSQFRTSAGPHAGLGLAAYVQVTSPLRRYLDLVVHQQLRAFLHSATSTERAKDTIGYRQLLTAPELVERIGAVEAVISSVRQAEQFSERHWTMVYMLQSPHWRGRATLVEKRGSSAIFLIPELALETQVHLSGDLPLNTEVALRLRSVDLPRLDARFGIEGKRET